VAGNQDAAQDDSDDSRAYRDAALVRGNAIQMSSASGPERLTDRVRRDHIQHDARLAQAGQQVAATPSEQRVAALCLDRGRADPPTCGHAARVPAQNVHAAQRAAVAKVSNVYACQAGHLPKATALQETERLATAPPPTVAHRLVRDCASSRTYGRRAPAQSSHATQNAVLRVLDVLYADRAGHLQKAAAPQERERLTAVLPLAVMHRLGLGCSFSRMCGRAARVPTQNVHAPQSAGLRTLDVLYAPQMALAGPLPKATGQQAPKGVSQVQVPAQVAQRAPKRLAAKIDSQSAKILKRKRKGETCATVAVQQPQAAA